jgi:hypothetical protein
MTLVANQFDDTAPSLNIISQFVKRITQRSFGTRDMVSQKSDRIRAHMSPEVSNMVHTCVLNIKLDWDSKLQHIEPYF